MKAVWNLIKNIDFFSIEYHIEEKHRKRHPTCFGIFSSLCIVVACLISTVLLGKEIFLKHNPSVSTSEERLENSIISLGDLPLLFFFIHGDGTFMSNVEDYLDIKLNLVSTFQNMSSTINTSLNISPCELVKFDQHQDLVDDYISNIPTGKHFCVNHNQDTKIRNSYYDEDSTFLQIEFSRCNESKRVCPKDTLERLQNFFIMVKFIDGYFDFSNYSIPVQYFQRTVPMQLSSVINKIMFLRFGNDAFYSDNDWIFDGEIKYDFIKLQSYGFDTSQNVLEGSIGNIFTLNIESPKQRTVTRRSYMKIQELLSKIGGLVNASYIIITVVFSPYFRFCYTLHIAALFIKGLVANVTISNQPQINHKSKFSTVK
jgi:hypothetical protein